MWLYEWEPLTVRQHFAYLVSIGLLQVDPSSRDHVNIRLGFPSQYVANLVSLANIGIVTMEI